MNFKELEKSEFENYKKILNKNNYCNSESSLTNMYIWQHYYEAKYCIYDNIIYSIYKSKNGSVSSFMPYGKDRCTTRCVDNILTHFEDVLKTKLTICLATEDFLDFLLSTGKYNITYEPLENSFDYVYNTKDLIELKGRKYHSKKNKINSFSNKYDFKYKKYDSSDKDKCIEFCKKVIREHFSDKDVYYENEIKSVIKAFDSIEELNLVCSMIMIDDDIIALSVGEKLNDDYALIHIEKADYNYRDAYPVINNMMLQNEFYDTKFVNREEDLGIAGLIKAKQSYHPCKMIKKYRIEISRKETN